ncbi:hypothetical protein PPUJ20028_41080 [Pseudomonas putida]|uniref:Uncharacterized protein n=1 Tax=Pseudomonas putida TaxID=303 RepID=A0AA37VWM9_PSEPU|nr:hypothetical protein PPUJ20028_41080 [Pseudomonas putida]GLO37055.1 hypothetical protein PPUN14671_38910 [Pseudomonas putida]
MQCIGVAEQAAFGVVFEAVFGLVGIHQAGQLASLVVILGGFTRRVDGFAQLAECVVLPQRGLARAVGVAGQLAIGGVAELFLAAVGVDDGGGQVVAVVGVLGLILQRVENLGADVLAIGDFLRLHSFSPTRYSVNF